MLFRSVPVVSELAVTFIPFPVVVVLVMSRVLLAAAVIPIPISLAEAFILKRSVPLVARRSGCASVVPKKFVAGFVPAFPSNCQAVLVCGPHESAPVPSFIKT